MTALTPLDAGVRFAAPGYFPWRQPDIAPGAAVPFGRLRPIDISRRDPLAHQLKRFDRWIDHEIKAAQAKDPEGYYTPPPIKPSVPDAVRALENQATLALYHRSFPTFLWTGIECSNPIGRHGERWDQLEMAGFYDPAKRAQQIALMKTAGIQNIRLGIPNHKLHQNRSWKEFTDMMRDFRKAGVRISVDLQHFGLPDRFYQPTSPEARGYLHPDWPRQFERFATHAFQKYLPHISAVTVINEPMITNAFHGNHWGEAFPGWGDPRYDRYFITRALRIGEAAVRARAAIERTIQASPDPTSARRVFVHNEALDYRTDNEDANRFKRFLTSDLILGQDWLLKGDYRQTEMYRWMKAQAVRPDSVEADTAALDTGLDRIRKLHRQFQRTHHKTMSADTVFGVDYYMANEGGHTGPDSHLSHNPNDYARDAASGQRKGLYNLTLDYWDRYHLPILHTETNMNNKDSAKWGRQQLWELAQLRRSGVPVLGFNWYSLMDQFGWDNLMDGKPDEAKLHDIGLFSYSHQPRAFTSEVLPSLIAGLYRAKPPYQPQAGPSAN